MLERVYRNHLILRDKTYDKNFIKVFYSRRIRNKMFVSLFAIPTFLRITLSARQYVHLSVSICLSAYSPVYLLVYLPFNQSFHLPLYLPVSLSVFPSGYLPTFQSACLPFYILAACVMFPLCCDVLKGL